MINLHVHLEGTLNASDLQKIKDSLKLKIDDSVWKKSLANMKFSKKNRGIKNFIKALSTPTIRLMLTSAKNQGFPTAKILQTVFQKAFDKYASWDYEAIDLFACPRALAPEAGIDDKKYFQILKRVANNNKNIKTKLRYCLRREHDRDVSVKQIVSLFNSRLIDSFDIAGNESQIPLSQYSNLLTKLTHNKIPFTVHAGELPTSLSKSAYKNLDCAISAGAKRIGHATRLFDNHNTARMLLEKVIKNQIGIEINLTSNVLTSVVPSLTKHPFVKLVNSENELPLFALCDDDPAIVGTLSDEFERFSKVIKEERKQKVLQLAKKNAARLF